MRKLFKFSWAKRISSLFGEFANSIQPAESSRCARPSRSWENLTLIARGVEDRPRFILSAGLNFTEAGERRKAREKIGDFAGFLPDSKQKKHFVKNLVVIH
jgi:hypothetical protein